MKITRQLRLDRLASDGTAQIQLTSEWEGNRLRLGTGAAVRPEHWDEELPQVRAQRGTLHASVNLVVFKVLLHRPAHQRRRPRGLAARARQSHCAA